MSTTNILASVEMAMKQSRHATFGIVDLNLPDRNKAISLVLDGKPAYFFSYRPPYGPKTNKLSKIHVLSTLICIELKIMLTSK